MPRRILLAVLLVLGGCEKKVAPPTADIPNMPDYSAVGTAAALNGPRKPLALGALPFTVDVPDKWQLKAEGAVQPMVALQGPAPSGDVFIEVASEVALPIVDVENLLDSAPRQADASNGAIVAKTRIVGPAKVLERRVIGVNGATTSPSGTNLVQWSLLIFTPEPSDPKKYATHTLVFFGLTREQYDQDHDFLQKIFDSLKYSGGAGD